MKTNHSPEPWKVSENRICGLLAWEIDSPSSLVLAAEGGLNQEDARRIVACVNACVGISNETLRTNDIVMVSRLTEMGDVPCKKCGQPIKYNGKTWECPWCKPFEVPE